MPGGWAGPAGQRLYETLSWSADELAWVVAHEVAHLQHEVGRPNIRKFRVGSLCGDVGEWEGEIWAAQTFRSSGEWEGQIWLAVSKIFSRTSATCSRRWGQEEVGSRGGGVNRR